jgi:hypothetical protein
MNYKKLSLGLGIFSIALGLTELLASRRIARALTVDRYQGVIKGFGAREIAAGIGLLQSPAHGTRMWNRVAGDGMDLGALALAARKAPHSKAVWGAIAFVLSATILDTIVALGLDRATGKTAPTRSEGGPAAASS